MKTTVDIDDALLVRAKKRAAELRRPLRGLIQDGLRDQLARKPAAGRVRDHQVQWITVNGGVAKEACIEDREAMHDWLKS